MNNYDIVFVGHTATGGSLMVSKCVCPAGKAFLRYSQTGAIVEESGAFLFCVFLFMLFIN